MSKNTDKANLGISDLLDLAEKGQAIEATLKIQLDEAEGTVQQLNAIAASLGGDGQDALTQKALAKKKELAHKIQSVKKLEILANFREVFADLLEGVGNPKESSKYLGSIGVVAANLSIDDVKGLKADMDEQIALAETIKSSNVDSKSTEKVVAIILRDRDKIKKRLDATRLVVGNKALDTFNQLASSEDMVIYQELIKTDQGVQSEIAANQPAVEVIEVEDAAEPEDEPEVIETEPEVIEDVSVQLVTLPEPIADLPSAIDSMMGGDIGLVRIDERLPGHPDLKHSMTIADKRAQGITLDPEVESALAQLAEMIPLLSFEGLTQPDLLRVSTIVEAKVERDAEAIVADFADLSHRILQAANGHMKGKIPRPIIQAAKNIELHEKKGGRYRPRKQTLDRLAIGFIMIHARNLLERNVEIDTLDPSGSLRELVNNAQNETVRAVTVDARIQIDFSTVFGLLAIQDVVTGKQMQDSVEALVPSYEELIQFYAELILKLQSGNKRFADFTEPEIIKDIQGALAFLRSTVSYARHYGRVTPKHQNASLTAFQSCRATLSLLLNSAELSGIVDQPLVRQPGDLRSACIEAILRLDDEPKSGYNQRSLRQNMLHNYRVTNVIFSKLAKHLPDNPLNEPRFTRIDDTSVITFGDINTKILKVYFDMNPAERAVFRAECIQAISNRKSGCETEVEMAERFFTIVDAYLPTSSNNGEHGVVTTSASIH